MRDHRVLREALRKAFANGLAQTDNKYGNRIYKNQQLYIHGERERMRDKCILSFIYLLEHVIFIDIVYTSSFSYA